MNFDFLNGIDYSAILSLSDQQKCAVAAALKLALTRSEIGSMLARDSELLERGADHLESSEEMRRELYGEELYRMHTVLVLLKRLPWLVDQYRMHGIPDQVLFDTLSDVRIWMDVCRKKTGYEGLLEYGWLTNHFSFGLFRLGRLQFIAQSGTTPVHVYRHKASSAVMALCPNGAKYHHNGDGYCVKGHSADDAWTAELRMEDNTVVGSPIHRSGYAVNTQVRLRLPEWKEAYKPGDQVLDMHIAEGCPLAPSEVRKSLEAAPEFFRTYLKTDGVKALTCSSWLMDDNIAQIQPNGNIAAFQRFFHLIPHADSSDWQTRQRAFGDPDADILSFDCKTSLQKAIQAWYAAGRYCRHAAGLILL